MPPKPYRPQSRTRRLPYIGEPPRGKRYIALPRGGHFRLESQSLISVVHDDGVRVEGKVGEGFGDQRASPAHPHHAPVATFRGVVVAFDGPVREVHDPAREMGASAAEPHLQRLLRIIPTPAIVAFWRTYKRAFTVGDAGKEGT